MGDGYALGGGRAGPASSGVHGGPGCTDSSEPRGCRHFRQLVDRTTVCGPHCDEMLGHLDHGAATVCRKGKHATGALLDGPRVA